MRISRPCYDKFHRCPGWAGGGLRHPRVDRCEGGYIAREAFDGDTWSKWRCYGCTVCDVVVLPYMVRWVDPTWWLSELADWRCHWTPVKTPDGPEWTDLWGYWHPSLWEAVKADVRHLFGRP